MERTFNREAYKEEIFGVVKESKQNIYFWGEVLDELKSFSKRVEPSYVPLADKTVCPRNAENVPIKVGAYSLAVLQVSRNHQATWRELLDCLKEIVSEDMYSSFV